MSSFKNSFEILKEINDKKKLIVISDKPKAKKPKSDKPVDKAAVAAPTAVAAALPVKAAAKGKKVAEPIVNEPPKNSLALAKETIKRQQAEASAKQAAEKAAPAAEAPVVEEAPAAVPEAAAVEGEAPAVEGATDATPAVPVVVEAPKLTLAEYKKLQEQKLFVISKQARRVDPNAKVEGFVVLKEEAPVKKAPVKPVAKPVAVAPVKAPAKGGKAAAVPLPVPAAKSVPKEKKEKVLSLDQFAAVASEMSRGRGRGRGGFRGGYRGGFQKTTEVNTEDTKLFPSL